MMYEALCRHLRSLTKLWGVSTPNEAADVIEELNREYESVAASLTESVARVRKLQSPRWVSVTERLPNEKQAEDVLCWIMGRDPKDEGCCVSGCYNTLTKSWHLDADWVDPWKITHWMPAPQGPEPPKEEE